MAQLLVLDSSVGVKWFRNEQGSDAAAELLRRHVAGEVEIVVPTIFVHEVLDVVRRLFGAEKAGEQWRCWQDAGIRVAGIDGPLVETALALCDELACTLYDAMAPAVAKRLQAPLHSADKRAHGSVPGVVIVGEALK